MTSNLELELPKPRRQVIVNFVLTGMLFVFIGVALVNLYTLTAVVPSCLWLAFVTIVTWSDSKHLGGLPILLEDWRGALTTHHFAESVSHGAKACEIRFGFEFFGRRFIKQVISVDKIKSVEWSSGQATSLMKRDMKDWSIFLWLDLDDPIKIKESRKCSRRPHQGIYCVGSPGRKSRAAALGISLVEFLRASGAELIQGDSEKCFVRTKPNEALLKD